MREINRIIEEGLTYLEGEKRFVAKYPFIKDPHTLPNNRRAVFWMLKSTEKRLRKNHAHAKIYQNQIKDMISRGVCRKVPDAELENYQDPIFYLQVSKQQVKVLPVALFSIVVLSFKVSHSMIILPRVQIC